MFRSIAILFLAALAAAAPENVEGGNALKSTLYNANFDDLGTSPAALVAIGPYDGLNYRGIGQCYHVICNRVSADLRYNRSRHPRRRWEYCRRCDSEELTKFWSVRSNNHTHTRSTQARHLWYLDNVVQLSAILLRMRSWHSGVRRLSPGLLHRYCGWIQVRPQSRQPVV